MEILSTGEKIKRARVYKGITLKELCGDKISISKMSCIENGKIKADNEVIRYIAEKLQVDYDYLVQDVYEQLRDNLENIKNDKKNLGELEELINYNLEYAVKYEFNDLALNLVHILFNLYLENDKIENIQLLITRYYDLYKMSTDVNNIIMYYNDMATFFMETKEYYEAVNYFKRIRNIFENQKVENRQQYIYIRFKEGMCYKFLNLLEEAYDIFKEMIVDVEYFYTDKDKGDFYHEFAILNILLHKVESDVYLEKALSYKISQLDELANFKRKNGECYFNINESQRAIKEIKEAIEIYPKDDKKGRGEFLIRCIETFYYNGQYEEASMYNEEALDLAINMDEPKFIERAYYFKGMICQKKNDYIYSEMYMNLATDFLLKYANREEKYKRYNEMAELYYNLGEVKESLKYFMLAVTLEKKL